MKRISKPNSLTPGPGCFKTVATLQAAAPFKNISALFQWVNTYYPVEHTHTHWEFLLIISGKVKHWLNGKTTIMGRGDACLLRPTDKHRLDPVASPEAFQHITFAVSRSTFKQMIAFYKNYEEFSQSDQPCYFFLKDSDLETLIEKLLIIQNYEKSKYEKNTILLCHSLILNYLEHEINHESAYPDWLNNFLNYLHSPMHFHESVETLATHTPYNRSALTRIFKEYMGIPIIQYVNRIKMIYAKRLIRTTNLTMLEISLELGYESLSTFNHNFKKTFGITPTEYKKDA